jgi:hypothetical protein
LPEIDASVRTRVGPGAPTLGDLAEDVAKREATIGRLRAQLWLVRKSVWRKMLNSLAEILSSASR